MAAERRVKGGATGNSAHSGLPAGRAARPLAQAQAHGAARVPAFPPTRRDTKGWRESAERGQCPRPGAAGGPERPGPEFWAGAGLHGTARSGGGGGGGGLALFPLPSPFLNRRNCLAGLGGAGRWRRSGAGRLHLPSHALMAERRAAPGKPEAVSQILSLVCALRKQGDAALQEALGCDPRVFVKKRQTPHIYDDSFQLATSSWEWIWGRGRTLMQKKVNFFSLTRLV